MAATQHPPSRCPFGRVFHGGAVGEGIGLELLETGGGVGGQGSLFVSHHQQDGTHEPECKHDRKTNMSK